MSAFSIISLVFGTIGVFLTIRQSIWCWPFALIATLSSMIDFFSVRLFGDMALQVFYFASGVYGWVYWKQHQVQDFIVSRMQTKYIAPLIAGTLLQGLLYYYVLAYFRGDLIIADALLTAASVTTTYMMTRKWLENWGCWIVIDTAYCVLYLSKNMPLYAVLYLVFTGMSVYAFISWKKQWRAYQMPNKSIK